MSLKVGESNELFQYAVGIDISANTSLDLNFTDPDGVETTISNPRVTVPAVVSGALLANEYMEFNVLVTDFTKAGKWRVCGIRTDTATTPDTITIGDETTFDIEDGC